ncbi:MAG: tyrosine-type recombinase/integrase [Anaerocolumna sp.]
MHQYFIYYFVYIIVNNCIHTQCTRAGIEVKSAHDIRRTVASKMDRNGVPIEMIRCFLGHNNSSTTRGYILNNKGKKRPNR